MQTGDGYRYGIPNVSTPTLREIGQPVARFFRKHARVHPVPRGHSDRIAIDFAGEHRSRYEVGHQAVSRAVNDRQRDVLRGCCVVLSKFEQRMVLSEYDFLVEQESTAVPLTTSTAQLGLDLLRQFLSGGRSPKTNLRNTLNDMFLLAQSLEHQIPLLSDDVLLGDFARDIGNSVSTTDGLVLVKPEPPASRTRLVSRESKGYVNSPWRARLQ